MKKGRIWPKNSRADRRRRLNLPKEEPAMKRSSLIYGFNPHALCSAGKVFVPVCITPKELGRIGVPARKVERVMQELSRLVQADPTLDEPAVLPGLARQIAAQLL